MNRTPIIKLLADNKPLNDEIMSRIISLSVTDNKSKQADELKLTLDDHDGKLELPKRGVVLQCSMGYVDSGVVDMGNFIVDSSTASGTPDVIKVSAKSANFKSSLKEGRRISYHKQTLGKIAQQIAARHNLQLKISPNLAQIQLSHIDQTDESDMHLLTRLCHSHGAEFTVKNDILLIFIANTNKSLSGKPLDLQTITRQTGDQWQFSIEDKQSDYGNVSASYHDQKTATRKTVNTNNAGTGDEVATKQLKNTYKDEQAATAAANAEAKRIKEQQAKFSVNCAYAYPAISTESPIRLQGWKLEIDKLEWTVDKATHSYNKNKGLTTSVQLVASL